MFPKNKTFFQLHNEKNFASEGQAPGTVFSSVMFPLNDQNGELNRGC